MRKYLNLKDENIGWLKVLELTDLKEKNSTTKLWKCRCKCGNIVYKKSGQLIEAKKDGYNLSCGCSKKQENLIGKIYNDFKIISFVKKLNKCNRLWKCQCLKCNRIFELSTFQLKKNNNICQKELEEKRKIEKALHSCFLRIKRRCYNPNCKEYKYYGGKGVCICKEWLENSNKFVEWSIKNGYKYEKDKNGYNILTIDRIDVNGNYEPSNCRWVTMETQANNKKRNIFFEYNNKKQTLAQWCKELKLNYKYTHYLIKYKEMPFEKAINYKTRKSK